LQIESKRAGVPLDFSQEHFQASKSLPESQVGSAEFMDSFIGKKNILKANPPHF